MKAYINLGPPSQAQMEKISELFSDNTIPWFDDGRWGLAGYAIHPCGGKTFTHNDEIYQVHRELGINLFELMHREDTKFNEAPRKEWLWDLHRLLNISRKRLIDRRTTKGDPIRRQAVHVGSSPKTFVVYPIPFHGDRVAQGDIKAWAEIALKLLGEMAMHTANEHEYYVTDEFVDTCIQYIDEVLERMATKYFGYTIAEIITMQKGTATPPMPEGVPSPIIIAEDKWTAYTGRGLLLSTERSSERPGQRWWPTDRDLSAIKGVPLTDAMHFAARWPQSIGLYEADWETRLPGLVDRVRRDEPGKADGTVDFARVGSDQEIATAVSTFDPTAPAPPSA